MSVKFLLRLAYLTASAKPLTEDLNMRCISAKFVPRVLTFEQKEHGQSDATDLLQEAKIDPNFMESIITDD
jgi:hypothetical protein